MKPKRLLIVTSLYPYGAGEGFITTELEHIARWFGEIELVPSYYEHDTAPRTRRYRLQLDYADKRWGVRRVLYVAASLLGALASYRWGADLAFILGQEGKLGKMKELARALYRARMFERFLADQARQGRSFDVIYTYWLVPETLGAARFRKASGSAARIVSRAHGGDLYEDARLSGYAGLRRDSAAGIDDIYCISDNGRRYLEQGFPSLAARFHTARLGVDDPGFLNVQPGKDGPLSIVSCAFVVSGKRLHLIADAIARLQADDPALEVRWTHIGDGPLFDEVRAHAASRLGARARAVFKGYMTQAELMALYRDDSFDVIVNVSDAEGIPVSLMEASAVGIPMVATDVGGNAEIVNAANGVLIPADADIATIAAAIARFRDREAARAYRRGARRHWETHYDAAANYERFGRDLAGMADAVPEAEPAPATASEDSAAPAPDSGKSGGRLGRQSGGHAGGALLRVHHDGPAAG
jgi:glycosyltransferase involved in cell wall biosynthesis